MTFLEALILGVVQGLTEFFPISSSAHLRLTKWLLAIPDGEHLLYFDLMCHAGTLIALLSFLRKDIFNILCDRKKIGLFILALLPLFPAYFLLKNVRVSLSQPAYLGFFLLVTSFFLFLASFYKNEAQQKKRHVICIGLAQAMALIPGISRSGATMSCARLLGWKWKEAARFSFLLAIPAVLGGEILETMKLIRGQSESLGIVSLPCYFVGFCASLAVGLFSVRFAFKLYEKGIIRPFAWYCLATGLMAWVALRG